MQTGRFVTPIHTVLSGSGASAKTGARLGGNVVGPCDEGDATGRGQPVKPQFDPFEPTVDIALKDFGGIRSKCPRVRGRHGVSASAWATAAQDFDRLPLLAGGRTR